MPYCSNCGAAVERKERFCANCGQPLGPEVPSINTPVRLAYCSECGAGIESGARFCSACGKPLEVPVSGQAGRFWNPIKVVIMLSALAIFIIVFIVWNENKSEVEVVRGNTVGNILNLGFAAQQGDWIYYTTVDESGDICQLNKVRSDGSERTKLSDDLATFINVVGDWIYYGSYNFEYESKYGTDYFQLCKIRVDGSEKTKICDDNAWFVSVVDGWIYYISLMEEDIYEFKLYKIRTDGSERTKLSEDDVGYMSVVGDWIYYNCLEEDTFRAV